ncbi:hypothetical protein MF672_025650 [Actinomadura sp. ATCC 31491]|uniref:Uncharacterized protein n=1 Tax=Actinomadura luzonensis TaxID=2805427 RepID=A0ABT0FXR8_9ACTN|nr:hypothetical protein [Actinomadura luzonensis]MCK2217146.1 hypothetical protein [Actinomadura luzonensis]
MRQRGGQPDAADAEPLHEAAERGRERLRDVGQRPDHHARPRPGRQQPRRAGEQQQHRQPRAGGQRRRAHAGHPGQGAGGGGLLADPAVQPLGHAVLQPARLDVAQAARRRGHLLGQPLVGQQERPLPPGQRGQRDQEQGQPQHERRQHQHQRPRGQGQQPEHHADHGEREPAHGRDHGGEGVPGQLHLEPGAGHGRAAVARRRPAPQRAADDVREQVVAERLGHGGDGQHHALGGQGGGQPGQAEAGEPGEAGEGGAGGEAVLDGAGDGVADEEGGGGLQQRPQGDAGQGARVAPQRPPEAGGRGHRALPDTASGSGGAGSCWWASWKTAR